MKKNQASRTAEYMALFRVLENFRSSNVRLFEDRFAVTKDDGIASAKRTKSTA
jgi:O-methyltransferase involved in polyketide biosynthesis